MSADRLEGKIRNAIRIVEEEVLCSVLADKCAVSLNLNIFKTVHSDV